MTPPGTTDNDTTDNGAVLVCLDDSVLTADGPHVVDFEDAGVHLVLTVSPLRVGRGRRAW